MFKLHPRNKPQLKTISAKSSLGFDYQVRLSRRKTTAIEVKAENVIVAAPFDSNLDDLHQWVQAKRNWIQEKLQKQYQRKQQIPKPQFIDGESWPYMGRNLRLKLIYQSRREPEILSDQLLLSVNQSLQKCTTQNVQRKLTDWYKSQAQEYMGPKTLRYARILGKEVSDITFRRTKTKWGHCTNRSVIQYNWLIMMAPTEIIDYLIAHEVSHLLHPNHSAKFWRTVAKLAPDYLKHRHWLKENGHTLQF